ncbi:Methyltransferase ustM [Apiospora marii]|uniref:Methyltransferase ustM n=1 Tax=Apiospora marii TaxID=335849 RepID=A0ABR1RRW1_9PEZI
MAGQPAPSRRLSISDAPRIASYSLHDPAHPEIEIAQAEHRIELVRRWGDAVIATGSRVLEIGCGQGNATAVLAEAVGEGGSVDAVDPAPPDYGSPYTLAQAQAHLSAGPLGSRITWHRATPEAFLQQQQPDDTKTWDVAVLAHCIWYFASPQVLAAILRALRGRAARLCLAEYALQATEPAAVPHVLATLATGMLEGHKAAGSSEANIRSPLGPAAIAAVAREAGWTEQQQNSTIVVPRPGLSDGRWEVGFVVSEEFAREVEEQVADDRVKVVLRSAREATVAAVRGLGEGEGVRTMDVWVSVFA